MKKELLCLRDYLSHLLNIMLRARPDETSEAKLLSFFHLIARIDDGKQAILDRETIFPKLFDLIGRTKCFKGGIVAHGSLQLMNAIFQSNEQAKREFCLSSNFGIFLWTGSPF